MTSWILCHPDSLDADEQLKLKEVLDRCLDLDAAAGHVASFAEIMSERRGDHLGEWIAKVEADQLPRPALVHRWAQARPGRRGHR